MEIWRPIKGYEGFYDVSNLGNVRGLDRKRPHIFGSQIIKGKEMKPSLNNNGYYVVHLSNNEGSKIFTIHRLVAIAFIKNEGNKPEVNHINGIKTDNHFKNLEWVTERENTIHAYKTGLRNPTKGELNGRAKLNENQVIDIFNEYKENKTPSRELGKKYNVGKTAILSIIHKRTWLDVTEKL